MKKLLFLFLLIPLLSTCQTAKKSELAALNKPLRETRWEVSTLFNESIPADLPQKPYIVFDTLNNYHGYLGCNQFFGNYFEQKKQKLKMTYSGSTKRLCSFMSTEKTFLKAIRSEKMSYAIQGDTMRLYSDGTEVIKLFATLPDTTNNQ